MIRRSTFLFVFLVLALAVIAVGQDVPTVLQIADPAYSSSDRTALVQGVERLEDALEETHLIPAFRLVARGWTDRSFAAYTAGRLEAGGFQTQIVEASRGDGTLHTWVLAGVSLDSSIGWIPVAATPADMGTSYRIGKIAWATVEGGAFDADYMVADRVVSLAPNRAPTASFLVLGEVVQQETTSIHSSARDADGEIVAYVWSVNGVQVAVEPSPIFKYIFPEDGTFTLTLTVYDSRGATATASKVVEVLEEGGCGCHG